MRFNERRSVENLNEIERYRKIRRQVELAPNETYSDYFSKLVYELAELIDGKVPDGVDLTVVSSEHSWELTVVYANKHSLRAKSATLQRTKISLTGEH